MWLEEILIDGFKSYAQPTRIYPLDRSFTAITGLNGSGKSNILDSICFVLGISQLSKIRVNQLSDLIYKQGQAGITKATVTLIFNNEDYKNAPQGYETQQKLSISRQIHINGTTKYTINNLIVKQKNIKQLFNSVSMNINNPNFLIMQGRIQSILTMKPNQLLNLLEETAGTQFYDQNRKEAVKTFENKQNRLNYINQTISEEIQPRIRKLENERKLQFEIQKLQKSIQIYEILLIFSKLVEGSQNLQNSEERQVQMGVNEGILRQNLLELESQFIVKNAEFAQRSGKSNGREADLLEIEIDKVKNLMAVSEQQCKSASGKVSKQEELIRRKQGQILHIEQQIQEVNAKIGQLKSDRQFQVVQQLREQVGQLQSQKESFESEIALISTGSVDCQFLNQYISDASLLDQVKALIFTQDFLTLNEVQSRIQQQLIIFQQNIKDYQNEFDHKAQITKTLQNSLLQAQQTDQQINSNLQTQLIKITSQVKILSSYLSLPLPDINNQKDLQGFISQSTQSLSQIHQALASKQKQIKDSHSNYQSQLKQQRQTFLNSCFSATGPQVYSLLEQIQNKQQFGLLGTVLDNSVFNFKSQNFTANQISKAIEISVGNRFFNLIFENSQNAAKFVTSPACSIRVTILPVDTINGRLPTDKQLQTIKKEDGQLLSDFVTSTDPKLNQIFHFLFSKTAIFKTLEGAKNAAYSSGIKAVTIDGDVVDPNGVVTGGSRGNMKFGFIQEFVKYRDVLQEKGRESPDFEGFDEFNNHEGILRQMKILVQDFEKERSQASSAQQVQRKLDANQTEIDLIQKKAQLCNQMMSAFQLVISQIQVNKTLRSKQEVDKDMHKIVSEISKIQHQLDIEEQKQNNDEVQKLEIQITSFDQDIVVCNQEIKQLGETLLVLISDHEQIQQSFNEHQEKLLNFESELQIIQSQQQQISSEVSLLKLEIQKLEGTISEVKDKFQKQISSLKDIQNQIISFNEEIQVNIESISEFVSIFSEIYPIHTFKIKKNQITMQNFSQKLIEGGITDNQDTISFVQQIISENKVQSQLDNCLSKLTQLHDQQKGFSGTSANLEELQKQAKNLIHMSEKLQIDKQKILEVIDKVDMKKNEKLDDVYQSVSNSLKSIFSILLPGSSATLIQVQDGVQFEVRLGSTSTTLSGLSGGQKSLLALSFTLALLRYKPSPIYILDEIDAALDLSHTFNIGKLIQEEFKNSQFVIVSLKEGMFNHANAIIKTRFQDGGSKIDIERKQK